MGPSREQNLLGPVKVVGGAKFPGGIVVSWPLAEAMVSDAGIAVAARGHRRGSALSYGLTWKELQSADAGRRRIVLHGPSGAEVTFGNMFAPAKLRLVVEEIRRRGIPVRE